MIISKKIKAHSQKREDRMTQKKKIIIIINEMKFERERKDPREHVPFMTSVKKIR